MGFPGYPTSPPAPDDPRHIADSPEKAERDAAEASAEVDAKLDEAQRKGYVGQTPDPHDNLEYSPQTGPDAPQEVPDDRTRTEQHSLDPNA